MWPLRCKDMARVQRPSALLDLLCARVQTAALSKMRELCSASEARAGCGLREMPDRQAMYPVWEVRLLHRQDHALRPGVQCLLGVFPETPALRQLRSVVAPTDTPRPAPALSKVRTCWTWKLPGVWPIPEIANRERRPATLSQVCRVGKHRLSSLRGRDAGWLWLSMREVLLGGTSGEADRDQH